ncbi:MULTISPECIES: alpha/beta hydrolase [Actibacterium]|uniref:Alpha/beta hydrolase n=1 Tax=Actibacterium naphthalenivorans TaxID=1614693 RepID=A0A840CII6_9RHOB|nr:MULTISPECIES: alpha/beta hydrolase [Actibacterium]ALG90758.1 hypothetical protein TQ29_11880 [Actibacterium sp. EMB200-NS6]MBB4023029.1 hypothetical protein [Actibacterium naphthalenivorans]
MPIVQINAFSDRPAPAKGGTLEDHLRQALAPLPDRAPIIILIHGFKFSPFRAERNPHRHILSLSPEIGDRKALSWPRHLGFAAGRPEDGLCIAFGWEATGHIWRAYDEARRAGRALAHLTDALTRIRPGAKINVMAHSLGARVVLSALPDMAPRALHRAVLMTPAELTSRSCSGLQSPAGRGAEFLNITSRENDLFDFLFEGLLAPHRPGERSLGQGSAAPGGNWLDLQIDHSETLDGLRKLGHRIAPATRRVCHWSPYLRPGMFGLYRAFLRDDLPLEALRSCLPAGPSPRWSRLLAPPRVSLPLPFAGKTPS